MKRWIAKRKRSDNGMGVVRPALDFDRFIIGIAAQSERTKLPRCDFVGVQGHRIELKFAVSEKDKLSVRREQGWPPRIFSAKIRLYGVRQRRTQFAGFGKTQVIFFGFRVLINNPLSFASHSSITAASIFRMDILPVIDRVKNQRIISRIVRKAIETILAHQIGSV